MADHAAYRVEVSRIIPRPPMEVFKAWTDPACIAMWISPGTPKVKASMEARTGGRFIVELKVQGKPWRLDGEVLEVVPGKRLRFTWVTSEVPADVKSVVTVTFTDLGGKTGLHVLHEGFPSEKVRGDHDAPGWQQIADVFAKADNMSAEALRVAASSV